MKSRLLKYLRRLTALLRDKEAVNFIVMMIVIAAVFFGVFFYIFKSSGTKGRIDYSRVLSVYNSGSSGVMALKEFLESMGIKTDKILKPMSMTYAKSGRGLILIAEPERQIKKQEADYLWTMARQGYTVILFSESEDNIAGLTGGSQEKGLPRTGLKNAECTESNIIYDRAGISKDTRQLKLSGQKRFHGEENGWKRLLADRCGIIAIEKKRGSGRIILFSDSHFMSNLDIRESNNGVLLYRVAEKYSGGGPVYFDEYHHGYSQGYTPLYFFAKREYLGVIIQIVLFLVIIAVPVAVRFGQYKRPVGLKDERVFYYSEGISRLMSERKYRHDLMKLMTRNFSRKAAVFSDPSFAGKNDDIRKLINGRKSSAAGKRLMMKVYKGTSKN
jgi:hypothetical protein